MHRSPSASTTPRRRLRLMAPMLGLALAGCNWGQPATTPTLTLGADAQDARAVALPAVRPNGRDGGGYFTMALPAEAKLPKTLVKVGAATSSGYYEQKLKDEKSPVVVNVIPNTKGFILEGVNLDKSTLKFFLGATELKATKKATHIVVLQIPSNAKVTSGIITVRDGNKQLLRTSADAKNVYVNGRVMVRFREGASRTAIEAGLKAAGVTYYRYPGMNYVVAYYTPDQTYDAVAAKIAAQPVFTQCTRDTIFVGKATASSSSTVVTPKDPRYAEQWALPKINAPAGWPYSAGAPDVVVAVLDTGIALNHPDLKPNLYVNQSEIAGNGIDDDQNGRIDDIYGWNSYDQTGNVDDDNGHGTEVAGIIAADKDNNGIVGLAYDSRVMACKVSNAEGIATSSSLIDGINYAVRNRASVINIALASNIDDAAVKEAIDFATTFNVTVVCAMGNDGAYIKQYPAAWSKELNILAVGATNNVDARPSWGTYGEWMTVSAPGEQILTTARPNGYTVASGTSHAAAHVSALAALIKALKPGWTPTQTRDLIVKTALDRGAPGFDNYYGNGRITLDSTALGNLLVTVLGSYDVDASSEHQRMLTPPEHAIDKDTENIWSSWRRGLDTPEWLQVNFDKKERITSIAALSAPDRAELFPQDFTIEASDDGVTWRTLVTEKNYALAESTWGKWNIAPTWCQHIRFNVTGSQVNSDNGLYYTMIAEVAFNDEEKGIVSNSSSSYYSQVYSTHNMVDKDPLSYWVSKPRKEIKREFAIVDLGLSRSFKDIRLLSPPFIIYEAFPKSIAFYTSNDKVNWKFARQYDGLKAEQATWYDFPIPQTSARYVRLDILETNWATSNGSLFGGFQIHGAAAAVAEVEVQ